MLLEIQIKTSVITAIIFHIDANLVWRGRRCLKASEKQQKLRKIRLLKHIVGHLTSAGLCCSILNKQDECKSKNVHFGSK